MSLTQERNERLKRRTGIVPAPAGDEAKFTWCVIMADGSINNTGQGLANGAFAIDHHTLAVTYEGLDEVIRGIMHRNVWLLCPAA